VQADRALTKILVTGKRRVGMIGLAFKTGTDDLRESPLVLLAEQLIGKGLSLRVYDPEVHLSNLLGGNRRYIETHLPHIGALMQGDLDAVIADSDVLVIGLNDKRILEGVKRLTGPGQVVLDLVNIPGREELKGQYVGLTWQ
jgi:GDP-mannose 6-dehydrogenase